MKKFIANYPHASLFIIAFIMSLLIIASSVFLSYDLEISIDEYETLTKQCQEIGTIQFYVDLAYEDKKITQKEYYNIQKIVFELKKHKLMDHQ